MVAVTLFTSTLGLCCGFRTYYSDRKKQWEIQRLRRLLSVHNDYRKAEESDTSDHRVAEQVATLKQENEVWRAMINVLKEQNQDLNE